MLSLPIVDTHVHLWDPTHFHMPWLDEIAILKRPYGMQHYQEQTMRLSIEAMICVEVNVLPEETLLEVRLLSQQAHAD